MSCRFINFKRNYLLRDSETVLPTITLTIVFDSMQLSQLVKIMCFIVVCSPFPLSLSIPPSRSRVRYTSSWNPRREFGGSQSAFLGVPGSFNRTSPRLVSRRSAKLVTQTLAESFAGESDELVRS